MPHLTILAAGMIAVFVYYGPSAFSGLDPHHVGEAVLEGQIPYQDLALEYPPAAIPVLAAPAVVSDDPWSYRIAFRALMALTWGVLALLVARRARSTLAWFMVGSLIFAFVIDAMFDIMVALSLFLAFHTSLRQRLRRSSTWIAVATLLKLAPAALFPLLWQKQSSRSRIWVVAIAGVAVALSTVVPAAIASRGNDPLSFHRDRLLHAESTLGNSVVLIRALQGGSTGVVYEHRSQGVGGLGDGWKLASVGLLILTIAAMTIRADTRAPGTWAAAALAVPALGPVASPQLFVWPLGFVGEMPKVARALFLLSGCASFIYFMVPSVRTTGTILPSAVLMSRNLLAIGAVVTAARWKR
jgi:hypothetical protein